MSYNAAGLATRDWKLSWRPIWFDSLVSESNKLNNSNKDCDSLILACFIREQSMADAIFTPLEKNLVWKFSRMRGEIIGFFIIK